MYVAVYKANRAMARGAHSLVSWLFIMTMALAISPSLRPFAEGSPASVGGLQLFGSLDFRAEYHFGNDEFSQASQIRVPGDPRMLQRESQATVGSDAGSGEGNPGSPDAAGTPPGRIESGFGISQDLSLGVFAPVSEHAQVTIRLKTSGVWGVQFPSDGSYGMTPTFAPPIIDEAYGRYWAKTYDLTLGRLRFSLGPVGLLVNSAAFPLEAVVADIVSGNTLLTGVYSRLSSQYRPGTRRVEASDDLIAMRASGKLGMLNVGYNYLYSGLVDETGHSIDLKGKLLGHEVTGEIAYFRPSTTFDPKFNFGWVPGAVMGVRLLDLPRDRIYVSYGWLSKGFTPTFSANASSSGGSQLAFYENTHGVEVKFSHLFIGGGVMDASVARLWFVDRENARERGLLGRIPLGSVSVKFSKPLGPGLCGDVGFKRQTTELSAYGNIAAGVTFSF